MPRYLITSIIVAVFALLILNRRSFIYPPSHRNTPSPKTYIDQRLLTGASTTLKINYIEHGPRDNKNLALTFDADMTPGMVTLLRTGLVKSWYNREIKKILDREQAKATIFFSGLWVKIYPEETKALSHDPLIEIANHSYSHPGFTPTCYDLPFLGPSHDFDEVENTQLIIKSVTGILPKYFRFPGGCFARVDLETVARLDLTVVHWDIASSDGFNYNTESIVNNVKSHVQNGSILVFHLHDGSYAPKTAEAISILIPYLRSQGYQLVTVSELIGNP